MQTKVFRPEIQRNRLATNWVIVHSGAHTPEGRPKVLFTRLSGRNARFIWFGCALLALALSVWYSSIGSGARTIGQDGNSEPGIIGHPLKASGPNESSIATDSCTDSYLFNQLNGLGLGTSAAPNVNGFVLTSGTRLGGALIATYLCRFGSPKPEFTAEWFLEGKSWRLKQISRPPERQPGDL
jgi:hypothetical protein